MTDKVTFAPITTFVNDTTAATQTNANYVLMQNAIDNTLSRDGTVPNQMLSSMDMNSNRILNLPSPLTAFEPLRLADGVGGTFNVQATNVNWSDVKTFGARGDGVTDDTASINSAISFAGGVIYFPVGTYII